MTEGLKIRAQIDTENVKGLLLINGGGAVALLAFLPFVLGETKYAPLAQSILWALFIFMIGLISAVVHNRLRRICSLTYEMHQNKPPPCNFVQFSWLKLREPCVCHASILFMWLSVIAFFLAGIFVLSGGFAVINDRVSSTESDQVMYKVIPAISLCSALLGAFFVAFGLKIRSGISEDLRKDLKIEEKDLVPPTDVQHQGLFVLGLFFIVVAAILEFWAIFRA